MGAIYWKELQSFFSSLIAYVVLTLFLLILGLFLWVFKDTSILTYNYAGLDQLFSIAPMVLMFLIPAVTMRSFSEEYQFGTIELLTTKPLTDIQIILGKFFANFTLVCFALIPTLIYFYSVYQLGSPKGNLDIGATIGSYIGLFFLAGIFVSIGLFCSSLSRNQIVAFLLGSFLCFFIHWAFEYISDMSIFFGKTDDIVQKIGAYNHYQSISKGKIDSRDVIYFVSMITLFIWLTNVVLSKRRW